MRHTVSSAISLVDVSKRFGGVAAVDRLTLAVPADSIYGFIGPNGSGKTTVYFAAMQRSLDRAPLVALYREYADALGLGYTVTIERDVRLPGYVGPLALTHVQGAS